jgi:uncharacterized protein (TIGR02246 family)
MDPWSARLGNERLVAPGLARQAGETPMEPIAAEAEIRSLFQRLLDAWNRKSGSEFASLFLEDGETVGFDGSNLVGKAQIRLDLEQIFARHIPATYVSLVRSVRFLAPDVALLRAVAGMVPPEQQDIHPAVNAVQTLVAKHEGGRWLIALFHNTPAAYHGRPEASRQLTEELRLELRRLRAEDSNNRGEPRP